MLIKTRNIKKSIFVFSVVISCIMTAKLYFDFGNNIISGLLFLFVGLCLQGFQVLCLLEYKNSLRMKRPNNIKYAYYWIITVSSLIATMAFGMNIINKTIANDSFAYQQYEMTKKNIAILQLDNTDIKIAQLQNEINARMDTISKLTYNVSERSKSHYDEISKLNMMILDLQSPESKMKNNELLITEQKKLSDLELKLSSIKGAFEIISDSLHVPLNTVMIVFLFFISIGIEVMVYSSSDIMESNVVKKKEKEKKSDQLRFDFQKKIG